MVNKLLSTLECLDSYRPEGIDSLKPDDPPQQTAAAIDALYEQIFGDVSGETEVCQSHGYICFRNNTMSYLTNVAESISSIEKTSSKLFRFYDVLS